MPERYVLYQYDSCPFCRQVRQFLDHGGIRIPTRDTLLDPAARRELIEGGGRATVPCLRIERDGEVRWLYESRDIIGYLEGRYADAQSDFETPQSDFQTNFQRREQPP